MPWEKVAFLQSVAQKWTVIILLCLTQSGGMMQNEQNRCTWKVVEGRLKLLKSCHCSVFERSVRTNIKMELYIISRPRTNGKCKYPQFINQWKYGWYKATKTVELNKNPSYTPTSNVTHSVSTFSAGQLDRLIRPMDGLSRANSETPF